MKENMVRALLFLVVLFISPTIQAQLLLKDDDLFLDPDDLYGDKWFETEQDKQNFLNDILEVTGGDEDTQLASVISDLFILSVRSDDDREYDNKNYHNLICLRGSVEEVIDELDHNFTDRHIYTLKFFLGENLTYAEYLMDDDAASGFWGSELINDPYGEIFISENEEEVTPGIDVERNLWQEFHEYEIDFPGIMNSATIKAN